MVLVAMLVGGLAGISRGPLVRSGPGLDGHPGRIRPRPGGARTGTEESAARAVLPSVVQVRSERGSGSGFVFDRVGHVLTNEHVVGDDERVVLQLQGGRQVTADVVGTDPANDVAVLRTGPATWRRPPSGARPCSGSASP